ncbi:MAG: hypothetical protein KME13_18400 [Myxacorys californica WJT36-NPBG1]|jgi:hypothetical protein|nr:hypothetical protein [Myxacorys californica WJT36-NPBG1]
MDFSSFEENIRKTGFPLEFRIAEILRKAGWSVINNRYYADDLTGTVREVDLIAYKVRKVRDFQLFTSIVISCKKSEDCLWALLSKDININDVNTDWKPIHAWTNLKALEFVMSQEGWKDEYYSYVAEKGVTQSIRIPEVDIFAFQTMLKIDKDKNNEKGKAKNDTPIYDSIVGLMKAQAYEMSSLPKNDRPNRIYQFNLVSIIDSDLIRLHFEEDEIKGSAVEQDHHVGRYILNGEATFAHVHFIKADAFEGILNDYDSLHEANASFFQNAYDDFYKNVLDDYKRRKIFHKEFSEAIKPIINYRVKVEDGEELFIYLNKPDESGCLKIELDLNETQVQELNEFPFLISTTEELLKSLYHYEGKFKFVTLSF